MTDFAKAQLLKYGWTEGKGLGKNENGITDALKPKLKFDSAGIGHKEDWNEWWSTSFNNAANNIIVEPQSQGVTLSVSMKSKNELPKHLPQNKFSYGNFLKTSTLLNGTLVQEHNSNIPKVENIEQDVKPVFLTDEELFKVCGGRTAHKGARHGLKLKGKLKRIEEQERNFLRLHNNKSESDPCNTDEETLPIKLPSEEEEGVTRKSKDSKRRKRKINDLTQQLDSLCTINDTVKNFKLRKKKRKKEKHNSGNHKSDETGKEEEDKEIGDMPFPVGENFDNWMTKTKNRKGIEAQEYVSFQRKKRKNKKRKDEYPNGNFDSKLDETVQHQNQEYSINRSDATHRNKLPSNNSPLNSSNDGESFPCPESPDTYTRNESNRLNYKILKKKKAKLLMKQKNMVQNIIENLEAVHVNAEDVSERIDTKRKLNSIIEKMIDTNIAEDKTETMKKNSRKKKEDDKRMDKCIKKKEKRKNKDKGIRKKGKHSRKKKKKYK